MKQETLRLQNAPGYEEIERRAALGEISVHFRSKQAIPEPLGAFRPILASSQRRKDGTLSSALCRPSAPNGNDQSNPILALNLN
jgi:hypothetical protein